MLVAERLMPVCLAVKLPTLLVTPLATLGVALICAMWSALVTSSCLIGGSDARTEEVGVVARLMLVAERLMPD